jgi:hypothetical protein
VGGLLTPPASPRAPSLEGPSVAGLLDATCGDKDRDEAEQEQGNAGQRSEPRASRPSKVERESERVRERGERHGSAKPRVSVRALAIRQGAIRDDDAQGQNLQNQPRGDEQRQECHPRRGLTDK